MQFECIDVCFPIMLSLAFIVMSPNSTRGTICQQMNFIQSEKNILLKSTYKLWNNLIWQIILKTKFWIKAVGIFLYKL